METLNGITTWGVGKRIESENVIIKVLVVEMDAAIEEDAAKVTLIIINFFLCFENKVRLLSWLFVTLNELYIKIIICSLFSTINVFFSE